MWISDGKFDESGTMGEYVHFLGPGGAWVDVPSGLGLEALAPGRRRQLQLDYRVKRGKPQSKRLANESKKTCQVAHGLAN